MLMANAAVNMKAELALGKATNISRIEIAERNGSERPSISVFRPESLFFIPSSSSVSLRG
jgi:hypothetical protein